jgi:Xaa-Pro dipeptidase
MKRIDALKRMAFETNHFDGFAVFGQYNLQYFAGFSGATALLIPSEGESILYVYGVNYEFAKTEGKSFKVELVKLNENLMAKIAKRAVDSRIKKLAVDTLGVEAWSTLTKETRGKISLKVENSFARELRKVKDPEEIELLRKAGKLTSKGMEVAYEILRSGMREYEVAAEIEYAMRKRGSWGTAFDTSVASGAHSAFPHGGCTDRRIREGDLVVIDFGATYKDYRSDTTRTLVAGKPSEKQKKIYDVVKVAQEKAFQTIRSNVKANVVDCTARKTIEEAGYGEFFVHGLGHGVGLEIHEPPTLNPVSKEVLAANNVVTDEPGIYIVGYGGIRIEDTVLVQENHAEKLTTGPYSLTD